MPVVSGISDTGTGHIINDSYSVGTYRDLSYGNLYAGKLIPDTYDVNEDDILERAAQFRDMEGAKPLVTNTKVAT